VSKLNENGTKGGVATLTKDKGEAKEKDKEKGDEQKREGDETLAVKDGGHQAVVVRQVQEGVYRVSIPASLDCGRAAPSPCSSPPAARTTTAKLSLQGAVRLTTPVYLTHLTTDRPMYQPGDVVRFRSLVVDRASLRPVGDDLRIVYSLAMPNGAVKSSIRGSNALVRHDEKGQPHAVVGPDGKAARRRRRGRVRPGDAPGGEWTLTLSEENGRFPPTTRKFVVNRYQKPEFDKKLDFNKPTYGPGDEVKASAQREARRRRPRRQPKPVEITVNVDDS